MIAASMVGLGALIIGVKCLESHLEAQTFQHVLGTGSTVYILGSFRLDYKLEPN